MKKLFFCLSLSFVFISCSHNSNSTTNENTPAQNTHKPANLTISKAELTLSAFAHGTDNYSEIYVYIDFEKDSSYCHKHCYNPALAYKAFTYTLTPSQIKNVLALLKMVNLQETDVYYEKQVPYLPTSTTVVYTNKGKFTINDYGLIANKPLPQIYNMVYKYQ